MPHDVDAVILLTVSRGAGDDLETTCEPSLYMNMRL